MLKLSEVLPIPQSFFNPQIHPPLIIPTPYAPCYVDNDSFLLMLYCECIKRRSFYMRYQMHGMPYDNLLLFGVANTEHNLVVVVKVVSSQAHGIRQNLAAIVELHSARGECALDMTKNTIPKG